MENNIKENLVYKELKENFKIIIEMGQYVVLNDGSVYIRGENDVLEKAPEEDEFVQEIRGLIDSVENQNEIRIVNQYGTYTNKNTETKER